MSLAHKAARGAALTIVASFAARVVGVVGTVVMTHLVAPDVIGDVSAAMVIAMTANWVTIWGFGTYAIVRGRGLDAAAATFHAALGYIGLGVIGMGGVALASTLASGSVAHYVPGMALSIYIRRIGAIPERVLVRELRFRAVGLSVTAGETVYAITTVSLASRGWGGDAMIVGNIAQSIVMTAIVIGAADLRSWATPMPIRWARIKDMLRFGLPLGVQSVAHSAARYWDNLAILHLFGAGPTGLYNLAYNLADIPAVQVGEQLSTVLLPSMAKLPPERRPRALERSTALLSLVIFPMAVGLGLVAQPLIAVALGAEWQEVAPLLSILAALSVCRPITWVLGAYMEAQERTGGLMLIEIGKVVILLVGMFALAPLGIHWSAGAVGIAFGLHAIAGVWMVSRDGPSPWQMFLGFVQPLAACGVMAAAVLGLRAVLGGTSVGLQLALEIGVGAVVYVAAAWVLCRATVRDFLSVARGAMQRRGGSDSDAALMIPIAPERVADQGS